MFLFGQSISLTVSKKTIIEMSCCIVETVQSIKQYHY